MAANRSMVDRYFYSADGELLIVLQQGRLRFATELGVIEAGPHEIVVIPRGLRFRASGRQQASRCSRSPPAPTAAGRKA